MQPPALSSTGIWLPGRWEGWGVSFNGRNYLNYGKYRPRYVRGTYYSNGATHGSIPSSAPTDVTSGGDVTWHGASSGLSVTQTSRIYPDDMNLGVEVDVTLTNTGSSSMSNVCYGRANDPDQGKPWINHYVTTNVRRYRPNTRAAATC